MSIRPLGNSTWAAVEPAPQYLTQVNNGSTYVYKEHPVAADAKPPQNMKPPQPSQPRCKWILTVLGLLLIMLMVFGALFALWWSQSWSPAEKLPREARSYEQVTTPEMRPLINHLSSQIETIKQIEEGTAWAQARFDEGRAIASAGSGNKWYRPGALVAHDCIVPRLDNLTIMTDNLQSFCNKTLSHYEDFEIDVRTHWAETNSAIQNREEDDKAICRFHEKRLTAAKPLFHDLTIIYEEIYNAHVAVGQFEIMIQRALKDELLNWSSLITVNQINPNCHLFSKKLTFFSCAHLKSRDIIDNIIAATGLWGQILVDFSEFLLEDLGTPLKRLLSWHYAGMKDHECSTDEMAWVENVVLKDPGHGKAGADGIARYDTLECTLRESWLLYRSLFRVVKH